MLHLREIKKWIDGEAMMCLCLLLVPVMFALIGARAYPDEDYYGGSWRGFTKSDEYMIIPITGGTDTAGYIVVSNKNHRVKFHFPWGKRNKDGRVIRSRRPICTFSYMDIDRVMRNDNIYVTSNSFDLRNLQVGQRVSFVCIQFDDQ